jgi:hypothetical protein
MCQSIRREPGITLGYQRLECDRASYGTDRREGSISTPSPVLLTIRRPCAATWIGPGAILTRHVRLADSIIPAVGDHVGREHDGPHDPGIPGAWRFSLVELSHSWERAGAHDRRRFFLPDWDGPTPEREWPVRGNPPHSLIARVAASLRR